MIPADRQRATPWIKLLGRTERSVLTGHMRRLASCAQFPELYNLDRFAKVPSVNT